MWWPVIAGPALSALGALTGRRGLARAGLVLSAGLVSRPFVDIARHRIVPGANDNLTGVAVLAAVAESLQASPAEDLRVVLASCGAEEVLQGGVYGFVERHLKPPDPSRTWVLNVDTVGSPRLIMLEGEGPVVWRTTPVPSSGTSSRASRRTRGVELRRHMRARTSTDAVLTSHAGYPTATLASMTAGRVVELPQAHGHAGERRLRDGRASRDPGRRRSCASSRLPRRLSPVGRSSARASPRSS